MGLATYNVGISGNASSKLYLAVYDNGNVPYGGYGVRFKTKLWSYESIIALPTGYAVRTIPGGEGGPVGPLPPQFAPSKMLYHVPGEWGMFSTARHTQDNGIVITLYFWSNKHPDTWMESTFREVRTEDAYNQISDTAVLAYMLRYGEPAARFLYKMKPSDPYPEWPSIVSNWTSSGGQSVFRDVFPNAKATNDNPEQPVFPGEDNEKDPAGGDGEGELEDDPIEAPEDPGISAVDSGLLTLYVPSLNNIHEFGNFLWSDLFSLDTFKKLFADPMEAVIGISVLPISVPHTAGAESITIGQIESGVFAPLASKQFVKKDCGTLKVNPIWNTALDYDPYTKFSIYLPYIGTRDLKTDDIMGKDLNVSYLIDILSGSCTAHIKVGGSVLYQFSGSCAVPIPLSGTSWTNLLTSSIQLAGTGIAAAMTAGASTVVSAAATGMAVAGTAGLVSASKQAIQRTGAVSGAAGMLGVQFPYIIRETPRQSLAKGYNKFVGYPSNITSKLSDLKGFTQVEHIHLENLTCTADEAAEIEAMLKEGVII